jgi:hypothetical protein
MTSPLFLVHRDRAFPLSRGALAIGRLDECQLVLEGREVSRRHARIIATPRGPLLVDRSRYGTEVNGARMAAPALLHDGDRVRVGPYELSITAAPWAIGAQPEAQSAGTRWSARLLAWRRRYGWSEALAALVAVLVALGALRAGVPVPFAALSATLAEAVWFYGTLAFRDLRRERREAAARGLQLPPDAAVITLRDLLLEFGAAEAVDSLLLRPICYSAGLYWIGGAGGILAGKVVADLLFWGPVLSLCHWRPSVRAVSAASDERRRTTTATRVPEIRD